MDKPRIPLTWSDWASGDWLGPANPLGVVAPVVAESIDRFTRVVNATLGAAAQTGPAAPQLIIEQILKTARSRLVGRDLTLRAGTDAATMRLHLDDLRFAMTPLTVAVGQLGTIEAIASNVSWDGGRLNALTISFANVHVRPGMQPALVIAPIRFHATIKQDVLDELLAPSTDKVSVELAADGVAYARRPGREQWGHAHVRPRIEGDHIRLVATGLTVRTKSFNAPRNGIPSVLLDIPKLPGSMRLTNIALGDHCVIVDAVIDEWSELLTPQQLIMLGELVRNGSQTYDMPRNTSGKATP